MKKFLKNLLRNRWSEFEIISQKCWLSDLFKNCSRNFDSSINMALVKWVLLSLDGHEEILKISSSSLKPLT